MSNVDVLKQVAAGGGDYETERQALPLALDAISCGGEAEPADEYVAKLVKFMANELPHHMCTMHYG